MDITFRTLGPWGSGKGANLQPSEVDNNFWSLGQAIVDLQNNPALPNSIASIVVSGTQMTIYLSDGTVMGPFALPVLTFRWRGPWQPSTPYAELDVFTVTDTGIFMVQVSYVSGTSFDPNITDGAGNPILLQLFGSVDAKLSTLSDVLLTNLTDSDVLVWFAGDGLWENEHFGTMGGQEAYAVDITGGTITGMPYPTNPSDVATKAYADALPTGATTPDKTIMSNISGVFGPAAANPLSDVLDYILSTTIRGTLMYRGPTGWAALAPGTAGQFLETQGAGFDPQWAPGGSGTVSLAPLPDSDFLANISGASASPVPVTLTQFLDHVLGSSRGTLLTRTASSWVALAPGTSGLFLKTQGGGADLMWDAPTGSGTVTSVAAGAGLTASPSPIVSTGNIGLSPVADGTVLGNTSGGTLAPVGTTLTLLFDHVFSGTQGAVMYRGATAWLALAPGTSGQILTTGGSAANPSWQNAPITGASTPNLRIVSNISGSAAVPTGNTLSSIFDAILSSARGAVVYRSNTGWIALAPGTSGQVLTSGGTTADPRWAAATSGALSALTDVTIGTLLNNDLLSWNTAAARWQNHSLSAYLDAVFGAARGTVFYRGAAGWVALAPGTAGQVLQTGGVAADPLWATIADPRLQLTAPAAGDVLIYNAGTGTFQNQRAKYVIGAFVPGVMTQANQSLLFHKVTKNLTIPANFAAYQGHTSEAGGSAVTTGAVTVTIARAAAASPTTFTTIGSIAFGAGTLTGVYSTQPVTNLGTGDIIRVRGPATPDATFADFHASLVAFET
jgi:hypothetical protein